MDNLPDEVVWLVNACLSTMEHIDLLLLLVRTAPLSLSPAQASAELRRDIDVTTKRFEEFVQAGLAAVEVKDGERLFSYHPASVREREAVERLIDTHNVRPVSLIRFVYERTAGAPALQQFADAFRIGGRKPKQ